MTAFNKTLRGIVAIIASQLAFLLNDTLIKLASETLPMGEIIFLRGILCAVFVGAAVIYTGLHRKIFMAAHQMVLWRGLGELGGTFFYLIALFNMPIANAAIIFQAVPLSATAGAALFLGETVGWRRWMAIIVGFIGVVLVVRPGLTGFDAYGLLVLVSVLFVSLRDLSTRAMPLAIPNLLVAFSAALLVAAMGALLGLAEEWVWPGWVAWLQLAGAAALLAVGYLTAIAAMRLADMSVTAPFRYIAVVFAIALGFLVWSEVPDALTLIGSAIIVCAGLYTLYRERAVKGPGAPLNAAPATVPPAT